jgi:hypothetical protein
MEKETKRQRAETRKDRRRRGNTNSREMKKRNQKNVCVFPLHSVRHFSKLKLKLEHKYKINRYGVLEGRN